MVFSILILQGTDSHPPITKETHSRVQVYTCFNDHRKVMKHTFDNLNEGGWIEYMDFELELTSNTQSVEGEY
ncbi:S-adenosyl-L-methionine-dependent methyltransferase [Apiospora rasikravindrae]|uniref:S-adenosyl-L-methionine-dependent methyltransferase n=1 Tax=Apiospora rasikravindrae TaxID=990691 RepID=A0ABR1RPU2_9PEZI